MKNIGIITLPLINNYGTILQNYALQKAIRKLGFNPITIDHTIRVPFSLFVLSTIKTLLLFFIPGKRRHFFSRTATPPKKFNDFICQYIQKTDPYSVYNKDIIKKFNLEALVVGSDQIWRPKYCNYLKGDAYLEFVRSEPIRKIAYAASFGVDRWEYTPEQTIKYKELISDFSFVSTREKSGIDLCQKYFNINAKEVVDPTLLLDVDDYMEICRDIPFSKSKYIAAYILNMSIRKRKMLQKIKKEKKLPLLIFSGENMASLSIPEWLAIFRDASYVVTDSFHGTVFSIIFNKDFHCFYNKCRGNARFQSLLEKYNSNTLDIFRKNSFDYLKDALNF